MRIVGKICGYHGIKGEIKVYPLVDDPNVFKDFESIFLAEQEETIESLRFHKGNVLLKLKNYDDRSSVEQLSGYVKAEFEEELEEGQFYAEDLRGLQAFDNDILVGSVKDFIFEPQQLLVLELETKKELLVPYVDQYVIEINMDNSRVELKNSSDLLELLE